MPSDHLSLVLINANVITLDPALPQAQAVAVANGRIEAVGSNAELNRLASGKAQVIDCRGLTLLPGFNDAHCHLPGLARRLQDLDCRPGRVHCMADLQIAIRDRAASLAAGVWLRGWGYDELGLDERRHPNRHDLDAAADDRPIWLEHRSGHAAVLNSAGLAAAGVHRETPDPPGGVIERDPATGEPTGVLYEMHGFLRQRLGNIRSPREIEEGMSAVKDLLNNYGITSVQDAGPDNGIDRWRTFARLQAAGTLSCRVTMMAGVHRLVEFSGAGLANGLGDEKLRVGHAKIMLTLTSGRLEPSPGELTSMVREAHDRGFPVAVHCIEEEAIVTAARTLENCRSAGLPDRIEHCAEGTALAIDSVRRSGAMVVTQPGFIYHNGESYRNNVAPDLLEHLYPSAALVEAGVPVAFGSDAPVIDPNPWPGIYSAVTRRVASGEALSADGKEGLTVEDALRMYTQAGARAEGSERCKGNISLGKTADLVLVDEDPLVVDTDRLREIRTVMTVIGGRVVWNKL